MAVVATAERMRAAVTHGPGKPDRIGVEEIARPTVTDEGVLVRVLASSVNPVDLYALSPVAHVQRGFKTAVIGIDFAGIVESAGKSVTRFRPGDEVFGGVRGAFADYVCVPEEKTVVRKPAGVSFEHAGVVAVAGCTALQAVRTHGHVEQGQRVLVNGASGGVGTFVVQIARAFGAEVTGVCSTRNVELLRSIGADVVIDYTKEDFTTSGELYDVLIDVAGSHALSECRRVLSPGGAFVGVGASGVMHGKGGSWRALGHIAQVRIASMRASSRVAQFIASLNGEDLAFLGELMALGRVRPVIDRTYELARVADALSYLKEGHARGKIAIQVRA